MECCQSIHSCLKHRKEAFSPTGNITVDQWRNIPCSNCKVGVARATYHAETSPPMCQFAGCESYSAKGRMHCEKHLTKAWRPKHPSTKVKPKGKCNKGHPFTRGNTRYDSHGYRQCRRCDKIRAQRRRDELVANGMTTRGTVRVRSFGSKRFVRR